jgi:hypothetical protein
VSAAAKTQMAIFLAVDMKFVSALEFPVVPIGDTKHHLLELAAFEGMAIVPYKVLTNTAADPQAGRIAPHDFLHCLGRHLRVVFIEPRWLEKNAASAMRATGMIYGSSTGP